RQSDEEFIEILNQVREGSVSGAALDRLNEQVDEDFQAPDDWVTVSSRRKGVDKINRERLDALDTHKFLSIAERSGDTDRTSFSGSNDLHYAVGARVMTVINDHLRDSSMVLSERFLKLPRTLLRFSLITMTEWSSFPTTCGRLSVQLSPMLALAQK